jgi:hypothetical protein
MLAVILGYTPNHPLTGGYPLVPSFLQILNFASFQGPEQCIAGRDGRTALCTQHREFYADFLKPATYKKLKRQQK